MSNFILPIIILLICIYAMYKKVNIYDSFVNGCKEGFKSGVSLFPSILAIIFASSFLISSNFIEYLSTLLKPLFNLLKFPVELVPISILRPISGNASLSMMIDIFSKYGPDSKLGLSSSIIMACTETSIYVITLYYGVINIKRTRFTYPLALIGNLIAIITSIILVTYFM